MAILQAKTEYGIVEGLPAGNQAISVFKGIPFVKPPVGDLRWRMPQPAEPWEGVKQCYKFAGICPQMRFSSEGGSTLAAQEFYVIDHPQTEDCLYINVWTPAKSPDEKLPVAVYIHGGGYETGYSFLNAYDGESFAKKGIILVTIPYRLHIFGFLALPELAAEDPHGSTGNYGTMDQVEGVRWVKRNIAAFGGDPDNLTVFGQSAGGFSVDYLCASPLMRGAFDRAIMQSGGGLTRLGFRVLQTAEKQSTIGEEFLEIIGASNVEEARAVSQEIIVEAYQTMKARRGGKGNFFIPAIDGYVLEEDPADTFMAGKHTVTDTMIGCTADEMRKKNAPVPSREALEEQSKKFGKSAGAWLQAIEADDPEACQKHFQNPQGDSYRAGCIAWAQNQADLGRKPAYVFYFTYVPPGAEASGAHHSVEHHYVFQTLLRSNRPYTGFDLDLSNELLGYWTNFIKTGDPNGGGEQVWKPYTQEDPEELVIAKERYCRKPELSSAVAFMTDVALKKVDVSPE